MNKHINKIFVFILLFSLVLPAYSAEYKYNITKNGVALYLGMLPAEMIGGHNKQSMHGGIPAGMFRYHIAVALFDDKTGERIKGVRITIKLLDSTNNLISGPKELETMFINKKLMYGHYMTVNRIGVPYKIKLTVEFMHNKYKGFEIITDYPFVHI